MCAAVVWPPIREPQHYNPAFKVEVCLNLPLWPVDNVLYEVTALCSQLELLVAREQTLIKKEKRSVNKLSESFLDKAQIVANQLLDLSPRLPECDLPRYLSATSLSQLYPRATYFLTYPNNLPTEVTWTPMEDHTEALSALHRLQGIANQINTDMKALTNHKYIAHQLALMHQCLSSISQVSYMSQLKQNIEGNFPTLKQLITELQENSQNPVLPDSQRQWLEDLTNQILNVCRNPPPEIQECLMPATRVIKVAST